MHHSLIRKAITYEPKLNDKTHNTGTSANMEEKDIFYETNPRWTFRQNLYVHMDRVDVVNAKNHSSAILEEKRSRRYANDKCFDWFGIPKWDNKCRKKIIENGIHEYNANNPNIYIHTNDYKFIYPNNFKVAFFSDTKISIRKFIKKNKIFFA